MKPFVILEHQKLRAMEFPDARHYRELHEYALTEQGREVLTAGPDYVKAKSHVGVIQTRTGFILEILPKIHDEDSADGNTRGDFIRMLRTMQRLPQYKHIDFANLKTENMPLFEIFISMFLAEVGEIVKKGMKSDYIHQEENCAFIRGKLVVGEHLRRNSMHGERFYVRYDEYIQDIPRNRILKSALRLCRAASLALANQQKIGELLFVFDAVGESGDHEREYGRIVHDRTSDYYSNALAWAMLFLKGRSFTTYSGSTIAFALLFRMETVFECYVGHCLKRYTGLRDVRLQSAKHYLARENDSSQLFQLRPDITAHSADGRTRYIIDAKWKILDEAQREIKYGVSQADMYQLLAYAKIYSAMDQNEKPVKLFMVYPRTGAFSGDKVFLYNDAEDTRLTLVPLDISATLKDDYRCLDVFN